ncbi:MAG: MobA/MobL family protein [Hydrococcus sp. SU_1_0]|nr:MobA/MobL family protein [Hydrococcus sp. SU_1_0]
MWETFDFRRKQEVFHNEILAPANAPVWVTDRNQLWNRVEKQEKRKDSQVARHFVLSLPNFMTDQEKVAVTKSFLQQECVWRGMIADVAWHDFSGKNKHNPHAHVMLSMRPLAGEGFGQKNRDWNNKQLLSQWRAKWAEHLNDHLAQGGYDGRVDHRSYQAQGIARQPMVHEGAVHSALRRDGIETHLTAYNDNVRQKNREKEEIARLEAELTVLREEQERQQKAAIETGSQGKERSISTPEKISQAAMQPSLQHPNRVKIQQAEKGKASNLTKDTSKVKIQGNRPQDPTEYAVRRQLRAMGGNGNFEIGIFDREAGKMVNRSWHRDEILRYDPETKRYPIIAFLKQQNSQGKHIYVRPVPLSNGDSQGLVLVDDLDPIQVEELKASGLKPACVIETSYRNHQVWLQVAKSLNRETATTVAKELAREYEGDAASASYQHFGRLAGFTNCKEDYADKYTEKFPWVRIKEATGEASISTAEAYLERARERVKLTIQQQQAAAQKREQLLKQQTSDQECQRALQSFERIRATSRQRYQQYDESKLDWVTLKRLAKRGYSLPALEYALAHGSPQLEERKKGHVEDYIARTVENVSREADVLAAIERQSRQQSSDRREQIEQWQKLKDRERDSRASSASRKQERVKQSEQASSSPDGGKNQFMIRQADIPVHPLASLDEESVRWIIAQSLNSEIAKQRFERARWLSGQDTSHWRDKCRGEYLKELGRYLEVKQAEGYTPYTDVEIANKLRMAGFGKSVFMRRCETIVPLSVIWITMPKLAIWQKVSRLLLIIPG